GDVVHVGRSIAAFHTDEHEQTPLDLPGRTVSDGDGRPQHPLDDRPPVSVRLKPDITTGRVWPVVAASARSYVAPAFRRTRRSAGGFSRVSSRCFGTTLPSALSIDCFT